jgi:hypothetical protein
MSRRRRSGDDHEEKKSSFDNHNHLKYAFARHISYSRKMIAFLRRRFGHLSQTTPFQCREATDRTACSTVAAPNAMGIVAFAANTSAEVDVCAGSVLLPLLPSSAHVLPLFLH